MGKPTLLRRFITDPINVASIKATPEWIVQEALQGVDWSSVTNILEEGGGTGAFTRELIRNMREEARLSIVESDPVLAHALHTEFKGCSNVRVLDCNAVEAHRILNDERFNLIVSGIPYSHMSDLERYRHLQRDYKLLEKGGTLIIYQMKDVVRRQLNETFSGEVEERKIKTWDPRNPKLLFIARKIDRIPASI